MGTNLLVVVLAMVLLIAFVVLQLALSLTVRALISVMGMALATTNLLLFGLLAIVAMKVACIAMRVWRGSAMRSQAAPASTVRQATFGPNVPPGPRLLAAARSQRLLPVSQRGSHQDDTLANRLASSEWGGGQQKERRRAASR